MAKIRFHVVRRNLDKKVLLKKNCFNFSVPFAFYYSIHPILTTYRGWSFGVCPWGRGSHCWWTPTRFKKREGWVEGITEGAKRTHLLLIGSPRLPLQSFLQILELNTFCWCVTVVVVVAAAEVWPTANRLRIVLDFNWIKANLLPHLVFTICV